MMREHYHGSFAAFEKDWITANKSWADFDANPDLHLRPSGSGILCVNEWMATLGDFYYKTVHDDIRRYDKSHLILGDRFAQYYNMPLAKSAAKWVDVISTNMGAEWTDGTFSNFFLDTLHKLTGKPVIITEFYFCAVENRSGNKNSSAGFPLVQTQKERAAGFKRDVQELGKLPYVIGAHWFQYSDEPEHGRGDGENYNMGLVDVDGRPYEEMIKAAASLHVSSFLTANSASLKVNQIPLIRFDPLQQASFKLWPRPQSLVQTSGGNAFADMYCCRDQGALYVGILATNYADQKLYPGGKVSLSERPHWVLRVGSSKPIDVRFAGEASKGRPMKPTISDARITCAENPDLKWTLILRIPWTVIGGKTDSPEIRSTLESHSRGFRMEWMLPGARSRLAPRKECDQASAGLSELAPRRSQPLFGRRQGPNVPFRVQFPSRQTCQRTARPLNIEGTLKACLDGRDPSASPLDDKAGRQAQTTIQSQ
jgi:hypothetical protein